MSRRVLIPLPNQDFDTTEVAIPWHVLREAGHEVVFATEWGAAAPECDPRLLSGVLFGKLGAARDAAKAYARLEITREFSVPIPWTSITPTDFDAMILPGGHAPGMRQYLGSAELREVVGEFFSLDRPVGAICHGVLVLARTIDPETAKSVLYNRRTTCLPRYMERSAYLMTAWKLGRYYRTYPAYVEEEVVAALASPDQFEVGPQTRLRRGTETDDSPAFVVEDGNYVSARWPGDSWLFARKVLERLG